MFRSVQARKKCPAAVAATTGTKIEEDTQEHSHSMRDPQAENNDWWSLELQRALDILAEPRFRGLRIQIVGQAGCGNHPPTADPAELEEFAQAVGLDASYSIVTGNGRVSFPVPLGPPLGNDVPDPPSRNDRGNASEPRIRGRVIA